MNFGKEFMTAEGEDWEEAVSTKGMKTVSRLLQYSRRQSVIRWSMGNEDGAEIIGFEYPGTTIIEFDDKQS